MEEGESISKPNVAAYPSVVTTRRWLYLLSRPKSNSMDTDKFEEPFTDKKGNTYWKRKNPLEFKGKMLTFGSDVSCNVKINNNSVAPLHFKLIVVMIRWSSDGSMMPGVNYKIMLENVQDIPVFINSTLVSKGTQEEVVNGDVIMIGKVKFLYEEHTAIATPVKAGPKQKQKTPKPKEPEKPILKEENEKDNENDYKYDETIMPSCLAKIPTIPTIPIIPPINPINKINTNTNKGNYEPQDEKATKDDNVMESDDNPKRDNEVKRDSIPKINEDKGDGKKDDTKMVEDFFSAIVAADNGNDQTKCDIEVKRDSIPKSNEDKRDGKKDDTKMVEDFFSAIFVADNGDGKPKLDSDKSTETGENANVDHDSKDDGEYVLGDILSTVDRVDEQVSERDANNENDDTSLSTESFTDNGPSESENNKCENDTDEEIEQSKEEFKKTRGRTKRRENKNEEMEVEKDKKGRKKAMEKRKLKEKEEENEENEENEEEEEEEKITSKRKRRGSLTKNDEQEDYEEPQPKKSKTIKKKPTIFSNMTIVLTCIQSGKSKLMALITENRGVPQSGFVSRPAPVPVVEEGNGKIAWADVSKSGSKLLVVTEKDANGLLPRSCTSLMALALHIPIVDKSWITDSIKAGEREDFEPYLLRVQGSGIRKISQPIPFSTGGEKYGDLMVRDDEPVTIMVTSKDSKGSRISPEAHEVRELKTWEWIVETLGGRIVKPPKRHYDYELCVVFKDKCCHLSQTYNLRMDDRIREKRRRRMKKKDLAAPPPVVSAQWIANCLIQNQLLPIEGYTLDTDVFG